MLSMQIAGIVGRDPETRQAGSSEVTSFSVAVSGWDGKTRQKTTTWVKVEMWGARGAKLGELLTKGDRCAACGTARLEEYNGKTSLVLNAQEVTPQGKSGGGGKHESESKPSPRAAASDVDDSFIPF